VMRLGATHADTGSILSRGSKLEKESE
jgi:hypothetical protein